MAKDRSQQKASDIIAEECQGTIQREFPSQWLDKTLNEIRKAAKQAEASAKKALKLLNNRRFKKT